MAIDVLFNETDFPFSVLFSSNNSSAVQDQINLTSISVFVPMVPLPNPSLVSSLSTKSVSFHSPTINPSLASPFSTRPAPIHTNSISMSSPLHNSQSHPTSVLYLSSPSHISNSPHPSSATHPLGSVSASPSHLSSCPSYAQSRNSCSN